MPGKRFPSPKDLSGIQRGLEGPYGKKIFLVSLALHVLMTPEP